MIAFQELEDAPLPERLHQKVMRGVFLQKIRLPLFSVLGLFAVNVAVLGWFIWKKMVDMETWSMLLATFDDVREGYLSFSESLTDVWNFVPWELLGILTVNIVVLLLIGYLIKKTTNLWFQKNHFHLTGKI